MELRLFIQAIQNHAITLLRYGISVKDGNLYLGDIKIPYISVARKLGIDRRVVLATINNISNDDLLRFFFEHLEPAGPFLRSVAKNLGFRCLTIIPTEDKPGIIAGVTGILARYNVNILQVIAEDPRIYKVQKLYIITEGDIPGEALSEIIKLSFIKAL